MNQQKAKSQKKVVKDMPFNNFMRPEPPKPQSPAQSPGEERPLGSEREEGEEGIRERNPNAPDYKTN